MKNIGVLLFFISVFSAAAQQSEIDSLKSALENNPKSDSTRIRTLLTLSDAIASKNLAAALEFANEALSVSKEIHWKEGLAKSYRQLGVVEYYKADYNKSMEALHKALSVSGGLKNRMFEASVYNNLANIYADLKDHEKALMNYRSYLEIARNASSGKDELIALFNIATIKTEQQKYQEAIEDFLACLQLAEKEPLLVYMPAISNNLARNYQKINNNEKALKYLNQGLSLAEENKDAYWESLLLQNLGELYMNENQLARAENSLLKSIEISKNNNSPEWEALSWQTLSLVYEKQNRASQALNAYKKHLSFRDSIINEEKKSELIKKDLLFENEKNQALAQAEIERQKTIKRASLMGGGGLMAATLFGIFLYKRRRDALEQKSLAEYNSKVAETELKALRSQMNPHFIFNSLNSINAFIAKNDKMAASDYLIKFAKLMRQTLENSEKKEIPLKDDLELLETYLDIESKRLDKKFTFEIMVAETIDTENTLVPPLILQPFMENSIWHGIVPKDGTGHIIVDVQKKGAMILYALDDNGVGLNNSGQAKITGDHESLGMKLTKNRIDIINQRKKSNGSVRIINKEEGVRVEVELPLELAF